MHKKDNNTQGKKEGEFSRIKILTDTSGAQLLLFYQNNSKSFVGITFWTLTFIYKHSGQLEFSKKYFTRPEIFTSLFFPPYANVIQALAAPALG